MHQNQSNGDVGRRSEQDGLRKPSEAASVAHSADDELDDMLHVRVKDSTSAKQSRSNKRLGKLFSSPGPAIQAVKRPLSSLLGRRPGSRAGKRKGPKDPEVPVNELENTVIDDRELDQLENQYQTNSNSTRYNENVRAFDDKESRSGTPDIPTLPDDPIGYGSASPVAHAPRIGLTHMSDFGELDKTQRNVAFTQLGDIDLSLLSRHLCSESDVQEEEVPWSWDYLYTSICTELRMSNTSTMPSVATAAVMAGPELDDINQLPTMMRTKN